jgi:hypothetical protein
VGWVENLNLNDRIMSNLKEAPELRCKGKFKGLPAFSNLSLSQANEGTRHKSHAKAAPPTIAG